MFAIAVAFAPHAVVAGACAVPCFIADCLTGTAFFQRTDDMYATTENDTWDVDPTPVELSDIHPDIDGWDDIDGIDLDGHPEDAEVLVSGENVAWLHSMLYSDYADPTDDDDRVGMSIPRSVIDRYGMGA